MTKENPIHADYFSKEKNQKPIFLNSKFCDINNILYSACQSANHFSNYEKKEIANKLKHTLGYFLSIID